MRTVYDTNNVFYKIINGSIPSRKLLENDYAIILYDVTPQAPIHLLAVPKGNYRDMHDFLSYAQEEEKKGFWSLLKNVMEDSSFEKGLRIISNIGAHGGQEVPHFHLHILGGRYLGSLLQ